MVEIRRKFARAPKMVTRPMIEKKPERGLVGGDGMTRIILEADLEISLKRTNVI